MQPPLVRTAAVLVALAALGGQAYATYRERHWTRLVTLADEITSDLARLEGMTNADKRLEAERRLYEVAPTATRRLFDPAQFARAVEQGWQLMAKPRLKGAQPAQSLPARS